jgi:DNA ligase-1
MEDVIAIKRATESEKRHYIEAMWSSLGKRDIWVFNKIITGGFRIGVSKSIVFQALSELLETDISKIAYQLSGKWSPTTHTWQSLFVDQSLEEDLSKPYPFCLGHSLSTEDLDTIHPEEWMAEWKWDGIRAQLIKRGNHYFLWSRGEELITDHFPEFSVIGEASQDMVLDGEIVPWKHDAPLPFNALQKRISRKKPGKKILEEIPVRYIIYDIMEYQGRDIRVEAFSYRRKVLEAVAETIQHPVITVSPILPFGTVGSLDIFRKESHLTGAEGLMLKRKTGIYHTGRKRGDMWKWKKDPYSADVVLIYAQKGHGRRANLFSDFTFAVWDGDELMPVMKAYSGLTDAEMAEITRFVRKNTIASFGPVSSVVPMLVFEVAFEAVAYSARHKSGIAVRFPRIMRWRKDKKAEEADTLDQLKSFISGQTTI